MAKHTHKHHREQDQKRHADGRSEPSLHQLDSKRDGFGGRPCNKAHVCKRNQEGDRNDQNGEPVHYLGCQVSWSHVVSAAVTCVKIDRQRRTAAISPAVKKGR